MPVKIKFVIFTFLLISSSTSYLYALPKLSVKVVSSPNTRWLVRVSPEISPVSLIQLFHYSWKDKTYTLYSKYTVPEKLTEIYVTNEGYTIFLLNGFFHFLNIRQSERDVKVNSESELISVRSTSGKVEVQYNQEDLFDEHYIEMLTEYYQRINKTKRLEDLEGVKFWFCDFRIHNPTDSIVINGTLGQRIHLNYKTGELHFSSWDGCISNE